MKLVFFETPVFTRLLPDYLSDEAYRALQQALLENPEVGEVMPAPVDSGKPAGKIPVVEKVNGAV